MNSLLQNINTTIDGVIVLLVFSCYYVLSKMSHSANKGGQKPPEASGKWPVIGHLPLLAGPQLPHLVLSTLADKYGPVFAIRIGVHPTLVVSRWDVAKELFSKHDMDITSRHNLTVGDVLGYNYASIGFSPSGPHWRHMRKIMALEVLSNRRLDLQKHIRADEVADGVKELYELLTQKKNESDQVLIEMKKRFGDLNLNVILRMVAGKRYFGARAESDKKELRRCRTAKRDFLHLAGIFVVRDALPFLGWLDIGGYEKAMKRTTKELDSLVGEWMQEHRKKRENSDDDQRRPRRDDQDFMDMLLSVFDNGTNPSEYDVDTVIKATTSSMIVGGPDTITVNLTWALSLLLNNPHSLEKVKQELDNVVGKERLLSESDIDKLVYLQAVMKETLRLYPPGPLSGAREFTKDCQVAGYHVPKGTRLVLNLWKMHRDPKIWSDDALEFKPDRFLTTHKDVDLKGQHFELLPFGGGRRLCIGLSLGLQMSHLALASLLHAFDVSTPSNAPVDMTGTP